MVVFGQGRVAPKDLAAQRRDSVCRNRLSDIGTDRRHQKRRAVDPVFKEQVRAAGRKQGKDDRIIGSQHRRCVSRQRLRLLLVHDRLLRLDPGAGQARGDVSGRMFSAQVQAAPG